MRPLNPMLPQPTTPESRLAQRIAALERQLRGIGQYLSGGSTQQHAVVSALPAAGRLGRVVILSSDNKLYRDNGAAWVAIG